MIDESELSRIAERIVEIIHADTLPLFQVGKKGAVGYTLEHEKRTIEEIKDEIWNLIADKNEKD